MSTIQSKPMSLDELFPSQGPAAPSRPATLDELFPSAPSPAAASSYTRARGTLLPSEIPSLSAFEAAASQASKTAPIDLSSEQAYIDQRGLGGDYYQSRYNPTLAALPEYKARDDRSDFDKAFDNYAFSHIERLKAKAYAGNAQAKQILADPTLNSRLKKMFDKEISVFSRKEGLEKLAAKEASRQYPVDPSLVPVGYKQQAHEEARLLAGLPPEQPIQDNYVPGGYEHFSNSITKGALDGISAIQGFFAPESAMQSRQNIEAAFRTDPELDKGFWTGTLPRGAGSVVPLVVANTVAGPYGVAAVGAGMGGGQARMDARAAGASGWNELKATLGGAAIGATEALPFFEFGKFVNKVGWRSKLSSYALGTLGEGVQEGTSQVLQNLNTRAFIDKYKQPLDDVGESFAAGIILGGMMEGLTINDMREIAKKEGIPEETLKKVAGKMVAAAESEVKADAPQAATTTETTTETKGSVSPSVSPSVSQNVAAAEEQSRLVAEAAAAQEAQRQAAERERIRLADEARAQAEAEAMIARNQPAQAAGTEESLEDRLAREAVEEVYGPAQPPVQQAPDPAAAEPLPVAPAVLPVQEQPIEPVPAPSPMTAAARQRPITPVTEPPPGRPGVLTPPIQQPAAQQQPVQQPDGLEQPAQPPASPLTAATRKKRGRPPKPAPAVQPVIDAAGRTAEEAARAAEPEPATTASGAATSGWVNRLFGAALKGTTSTLTAEERSTLTAAKEDINRQGELLKQARSGGQQGNDAALLLVAAHMDNIKALARKYANDKASVDDLVTVGQQAMHAALVAGKAVTTGKMGVGEQSLAGDADPLGGFVPGKSPIGSFLVSNRNSYVANKIRQAAEIERPSQEAIEAEQAAIESGKYVPPDADKAKSLEGMAEKKGVANISIASDESTPDEILEQREEQEKAASVFDELRSLIASMGGGPGKKLGKDAARKIAETMAAKHGGDPEQIAAMLESDLQLTGSALNDFLKAAHEADSENREKAYRESMDGAVSPVADGGPVYVMVSKELANDPEAIRYARVVNASLRKAAKTRKRSGISESSPIVIVKPSNAYMHGVALKIAKLFGRDIFFYRAQSASASAGQFVRNAPNAVGVEASESLGIVALSVVMHEITHSIEATDKQLFLQLLSLIPDNIQKELLNQYASGFANPNKTIEELYENGQVDSEVAATAIENAFYRQEFWDAIEGVTETYDGRRSNLAQRMMRMIERWWRKIVSLIQREPHPNLIPANVATQLGVVMSKVAAVAKAQAAKPKRQTMMDRIRGRRAGKEQAVSLAPSRSGLPSLPGESHSKSLIDKAASENPLTIGNPKLAQAGTDPRARAASRVGQEFTEGAAPNADPMVDAAAKAVFRDAKARENLWQKVIDGEMLSDIDTVAFSRYLIDFKMKEADAGRVPYAEIVAAAAGYRIGGRETARGLRARLDNWQTPEERARAFAQEIFTPPDTMIEEMKEELDILNGTTEGGAGSGSGTGGLNPAAEISGEVGEGLGPGQGAGAGPGQGPGQGAGLGPGAGPGAGPGLGPGLGPGKGPGTGKLTPRQQAAKKRLDALRREWSIKARIMRKKILKSSNGKIDIAKLTPEQINDPNVMIRLIRKAQAHRSSYGDMVYEYWINSILGSVATHLANLGGALADIATELAFRQPLQAAMNGISKMLTGKHIEGAARLSDYKFMAKRFKTAIRKAVSNAILGFQAGSAILERQLRIARSGGTGTKLDDNMVAVPGKVGEVVRIPTRILIAADEFFKGFLYHIYIEAMAARHVQDKMGLSLKDPSFQKEVDKIVGDPKHDAHMDAVVNAERLTLQESLPKPLTYLTKFRDWTQKESRIGSGRDSKTIRRLAGRVAPGLIKAAGKKQSKSRIRAVRDAVEAPLQIARAIAISPLSMAYHIPFVRTIVNSMRREFAQSLWASPVLLLQLMHKGINSTMGVDGNAIKGKDAVRKASEQMVGFALAAIFASFLPDDDDETGDFDVTGTIPRWWTHERRFSYLAGKPSSSVRIGDSSFDISRLDPMAGTVTLAKDIVDYYRDVKSGDEKAFDKFAQKMVSRVTEKSFAEGITRAIDALQSEEGIMGWAARHYASLVPNTVRSVARATDEEVLDSKSKRGFFDRLSYEAFPSEGRGQLPLVDPFGKDIKKGEEGFLSRAISPIRIRSAKGTDKWMYALGEYNKRVGSADRYMPSVQRERYFTYERPDTGETIRLELTEQELRKYLQDSGREAYEAITYFEGKGDLNPRKLDRGQVDKIREIFSKSRKKYRDEIVARKLKEMRIMP